MNLKPFSAWDQTILPPLRIDRTKMTLPGLPEDQWIEAHHNEHGELICFVVHYCGRQQYHETWREAVSCLAVLKGEA
jgi:hypothetical protein